MPGGGDGEGAKCPRCVRNVWAGGPLTRPAIPGQVGPPQAEQRRREERFCPASSACTRPELRLHEPTPRSETLQPTSPGVSARGAGDRRRKRDNCIPGPEMPASSHPPRRWATLLALPAPARAQGHPWQRARGPRAFPPPQENKMRVFLRTHAAPGRGVGAKTQLSGQGGGSARGVRPVQERARVAAAPAGQAPRSPSRPPMPAAAARPQSGLPARPPGLQAHPPPHLRGQDTCACLPGAPGLLGSLSPTGSPESSSEVRDLERNTTNHKEKTAPTHSCLAHFPLCLIMMTSRILFLEELYLPPDKPLLSALLGDLLGK